MRIARVLLTVVFALCAALAASGQGSRLESFYIWADDPPYDDARKRGIDFGKPPASGIWVTSCPTGTVVEQFENPLFVPDDLSIRDTDVLGQVWVIQRCNGSWVPSEQVSSEDHVSQKFQLDADGTLRVVRKYSDEGVFLEQYAATWNLDTGAFTATHYEKATADCSVDAGTDVWGVIERSYSFEGYSSRIAGETKIVGWHAGQAPEGNIGFPEPFRVEIVETCPSKARVVDPASLPFGTPVRDVARSGSAAHSISADGTSIAIIHFRSDNPAPANFRVTTDSTDVEDGAVLFRWNPSFRSDPTLQSGSGASSIANVDLVRIGDDYHGFALLRAPGARVLRDRNYSLKVEVTQKELKHTTTLGVVAPPVVLIHGLWSNAAVWESMKEYLVAHYHAAAVTVADYSYWSSQSFASAGPQGALDLAIRSVLDESREAGVISTQADVVAHSMGALVSRVYAAQSRYRHQGNYSQGSINRLITVASPHAGSPLADWLLRNADRRPRLSVIGVLSGGAPLGTFMRRHMGAVDAGAIFSLALGSPDQSLMATPDLRPFWSVCAIASAGNPAERMLNAIAYAYAESPTTDLRELFNREDHDTIVPLSSCAAGPPFVFNDLQGLTHAEIDGSEAVTASSRTFGLVKCYLLEQFPCFAPVALSETATAEVPPLASIDLSVMTEISSSSITLTPVSSAVLGLNDRTKLRASGSGNALKRVVFLIDDEFHDVVSAPFEVTIRPNEFRDINVTVFALFEGNRYASWKGTYSVAPSAQLLSLAVQPRHVRLPVGSIFQIAPIATYSNGVADVRRQAQYSTTSGTSVTVAVGAEGVVEARAAGRDVIRVAWGSHTAEVVVEVFMESPSRRRAARH